jgi:Ca2+-binding RTX toxin-like protein
MGPDMPRSRACWLNPRLIALAMVAALVLLASVPAQSSAFRRGPIHCTINGTPHRDRLIGTPHRDVICARGGPDIVRAAGGDDYVFGGPGADTISGGAGSDHLLGGPDNDRIHGGAGGDFLYGETGDDRLAAGPGADAMFGDVGEDALNGGPGLNHFSGGPDADRGDPNDALGYPACPDLRNGYCEIHLHVDIPFSFYCPSFSTGFGLCAGKSSGNPAWSVYVQSLPATFAQFGWIDAGGHKETQYTAVQAVVPTALLQGWVPHAASPAFAVERAYTVLNPGFGFYTPLGAYPGTPGGPLWLNFVNGYVGADMYIDGYLARA